MLLVSVSIKFKSTSLYDQPFLELQAILTQVYQMIPK